MTIAQLCREYLHKARSGDLITRRGKLKKATTIYTDQGRVERHIIPLLGHRTVKDLTTADVRAFLRDVIAGKSAADVKTRKRGRAIVTGGRGTGARTLGLLGAILSYAVSEGYRDSNPVRGVVRPADAIRHVRLDEFAYRTMNGLLDRASAAGEPWQAMEIIRVIALTGCRRGEIERLRRSEVDLVRQVLRLGDTKAGRSIRPIGAEAVAALRSAMARSSGEFVFPSTKAKGNPFVGLPKAWLRIIGDNLPGVSPHGLRHGFASTAEDLGFTVPTIKALLGHAGASVTEGYIHKADTALVAAADQISRFIADAMAGVVADGTNVVE
jgi:integrase